MPVAITKRNLMAKTRKRGSKSAFEKATFTDRPVTKTLRRTDTSRSLDKPKRKEETKRRNSNSNTKTDTSFLLYFFALVMIIVAYVVVNKQPNGEKNLTLKDELSFSKQPSDLLAKEESLNEPIKKELDQSLEELKLNKVNDENKKEDVKSIKVQKETTKIEKLDDISTMKVDVNEENLNELEAIDDKTLAKKSSVMKTQEVKKLDAKKLLPSETTQNIENSADLLKTKKLEIIKKQQENDKDISDTVEQESLDKIEQESSDKTEQESLDKVEQKSLDKVEQEILDKIEEENSNKVEKEISDRIEQESSDKIEQENSVVETENFFAWSPQEKIEETFNESSDDDEAAKTEKDENDETKVVGVQNENEMYIDSVEFKSDDILTNNIKTTTNKEKVNEKNLKKEDTNHEAIVELKKVIPKHKEGRLVNRKKSYIAQFVREVNENRKLRGDDIEDFEDDEEEDDDDEEEENNESDIFSQISDGVWKRMVKKGFGRNPKKGDQVSLHCVGYIDSEPRRKFWDTHELGQRKFSFKVEEKQVIKGFDEAAVSMKLSEISFFKIDSKKAYGKFGFEAWEIPPNSNLFMEFELINIKRGRKTKN